ncbi:hypothetical protein AAEU28_08905 [Pseudoalteromonas sp. SS15]|uniref:hypothetical protein n=1 Tax=Pseudoalteromonas sp. SS15 TaxID=3139393 RepID=UPI003BA9E6E3
MKQFLLIFVFALLTGCAAQYPNQDVTGKAFPSVSGGSLEKERINLPDFVKGEVALFLVGYKQDSQFDIDRWLIGLDMKGADIKAYELPTIAGMFPRMFSTQIDEGMRRGIPKELWGGVITIYEDGEKIQAFTGNENPNNARVMLLDKNGKIIYFYDRGFSVSALNEVLALAEAQ